MSRRTGAALLAAALGLVAPAVSAATEPATAAPGRAAAAACVPAGAIGAHWQHLGGAASFLGPCLTGEVAAPRGRVQHFRGGSVYWSPATGAHEVHGEIRAAYDRIGGSGSPLGLPVTDESRTPHAFGAYNHFQDGSIYWSPTNGARVVRGSIRAAWAAQGWETGPLGFPTSDEFATATGARSDFSGGSLVFHAPTGTVRRAAAQTPFRSSVAPVSAARLGSSYRPGCPVGPAALRLVRVTHLGFDGRGRDGEVVVSARVADAVVRVFARLYDARFPVQRLTTVDAYGGSDDASMAANNTSGFNCRRTTGGTAWSQHANGEALDVNPVQNPYVRGTTVLPPAGRAYVDRSAPGLGVVRAGDAAVRAFTAEGWGWGGAWTSAKDYQHFSRSGR
jgi:hypothetical protein